MIVSYCKPWNEPHFLFDMHLLYIPCQLADYIKLHSFNYKLLTATVIATNTGHKYTKKDILQQRKQIKKYIFFFNFYSNLFVKYIWDSLVRIAFTSNLFLVNEITDDYTPEQSYMLRGKSLKNSFTNHKSFVKDLSKNCSTDIF